jgi:growth hormone-inducible transmembrane protein
MIAVLYLGGPLLAGVTVVALSSLAPMILPVTALRTLALTEALSLYGGLAVFSAFILYDTQKILARARMGAMGGRKLDPVSDSISLTLDTLNIFVRMVCTHPPTQGNRMAGY